METKGRGARGQSFRGGQVQAWAEPRVGEGQMGKQAGA